MTNTIPPGKVVLDEIGLMPTVTGLQQRFPRLNKSTVWRWAQPAPKGTDGLIPPRYHQPLLQLAQRLGKSLTTDDLVLGRRG